ncbi:hypothetical protein V6N11_025204 [Hibiscus sabdariffa]|uniref:Uncharacterized protein n=1 Tax=Hibiscus sabdariffa TaxID=183260 RepID=A0ABR2QPE3_9ROSI
MNHLTKHQQEGKHGNGAAALGKLKRFHTVSMPMATGDRELGDAIKTALLLGAINREIGGILSPEGVEQPRL